MPVCESACMCVHGAVHACNQDEFPSARAREDAELTFGSSHFYDQRLIGFKRVIRILI